jgi:hypothetical protein
MHYFYYYRPKIEITVEYLYKKWIRREQHYHVIVNNYMMLKKWHCSCC